MTNLLKTTLKSFASLVLTTCLLFTGCNSSDAPSENPTTPPKGTPTPTQTTQDLTPEETKITTPDNICYSIADPVTVNNMSIYLIHGEDTIKDDFLTLNETLENKQVTIKETSNVSELLVSNSSDKPVFIQAGEIIKGGKQDRTFAYDFIVPPNSRELKITTHCVESNRWAQRGRESVGTFNSSKMALNNSNRSNAQHLQLQETVWQDVADVQTTLRSNLDTNVKDARSATSMQLTLENKKLKKESGEYESKYKDLLKDKKNVIGYALTVNGKIVNIDIYANSQLFRKLWDKNLKSSIVEAIIKSGDKKKYEEVSVKEIEKTITGAPQKKTGSKHVNKETSIEEYQETNRGNIQTIYGKKRIHNYYYNCEKPKNSSKQMVPQGNRQRLQLQNNEPVQQLENLPVQQENNNETPDNDEENNTRE